MTCQCLIVNFSSGIQSIAPFAMTKDFLFNCMHTPFPFALTRKSATVRSLCRPFCLFIVISSSFILSSSNSLFAFFLYIANLACNSADDVDSRHWLAELMVMSIYRVTTNRPRSFSLSLSLLIRSVYFFFFFCIFFTSAYSRCCICMWLI